MATIRCPSCGYALHESAEICLACAYPLRERQQQAARLDSSRFRAEEVTQREAQSRKLRSEAERAFRARVRENRARRALRRKLYAMILWGGAALLCFAFASGDTFLVSRDPSPKQAAGEKPFRVSPSGETPYVTRDAPDTLAMDELRTDALPEEDLDAFITAAGAGNTPSASVDPSGPYPGIIPATGRHGPDAASPPGGSGGDQEAFGPFSALLLLNIFTQDQTEAESAYLEKKVYIEGVASEATQTLIGASTVEFRFDEGARRVLCFFPARHAGTVGSIRAGQHLRIAGRVRSFIHGTTLYLDNCAIIPPEGNTPRGTSSKPGLH